MASRRRSRRTFISASLGVGVAGWAAARPAHAGLSPQPAPPLRLAIAGLVHGHVSGFVRSAARRSDVVIVAVAEPDAALRSRKLRELGLPAEVGGADLDALIERTKPEALAIFTSTVDHRAAVEAAARHRIPAMMEKPLAVSVEDARAMQRAARDAGIHVFVNYETTWYPGLAAAWQVMKTDAAGGAIRKMVAMDGHPGPKEIGVGPEFLSWLTDPVANGGGALFDFGCYGANLMTWLMDDARPTSVRAITQTFKPQTYARVDDEATIVLEYAGAQGIVQASWNWPFNRKDFEVYGERAYVIATGPDDVRVRRSGASEQRAQAAELPADERDAVAYLTAIARGRLKPAGRSSVENNTIVTEILVAARESAKTGAAVRLGG